MDCLVFTIMSAFSFLQVTTYLRVFSLNFNQINLTQAIIENPLYRFCQLNLNSYKISKEIF